jgi:hypothetical protein
MNIKNEKRIIRNNNLEHSQHANLLEIRKKLVIANSVILIDNKKIGK